MAPTIDDLLVQCGGGLAKFQVRMMCLLGFVVVQSAFMTYMPMFILTIPKHRCALENDTFALQSPEHVKIINASIPWDGDDRSSCTKYSTEVTDNGTVRKQVECTRHVYDTSFFVDSFIEKFDLVCDRMYLRTHANSAMMAGKIVAALTQGFASDMFGRRKVLLFLIVFSTIMSTLSAFPFNIPSLLALRFCIGFCTTSVYLASYVAGLEFLCLEQRRLFAVIWAVVWVIGGFLLTGIAFFIRESQHLVLTASLPFVLLFSYYWLVPESPRWLISRRRINEAQKVFERIARINGKEFPSELFEKVAAKELGENRHEKEVVENGNCVVVERNQKTDNFFALLRHKKMAFQFGILFFNWFANSLTYYALMFNVSNLPGSIYTNFLLLNCVDLVANIFCYVVLDRFGRKWSYVGFMLLTAFGCLLCIIPVLLGSDDSESIINGLALAGRGGVATSFVIIYLISAELFPTSVRNVAMGSVSTASKCGSLFSPYVADLGILIGGPFRNILPMILCGGVAIVAVLLSLFLPETAGKSLPNTIADALAASKVKDKNHRKCEKAEPLVNLSPESEKN